MPCLLDNNIIISGTSGCGKPDFHTVKLLQKNPHHWFCNNFRIININRFSLDCFLFNLSWWLSVLRPRRRAERNGGKSKQDPNYQDQKRNHTDSNVNVVLAGWCISFHCWGVFSLLFSENGLIDLFWLSLPTLMPVSHNIPVSVHCTIL